MALLMVHLLAADRWAQRHPEYLEDAEFYYGVISPDAIHIRDGNDKSHKNEIHLNNWGSPHPQDVIDYWLKHSSPFDIGYGVHVLTDAQWVPRYRTHLPNILRADGLMNTDIYYNDAFVTDFQLYGRLPRLHRLLDMIENADTPGDHPLLTDYELGRWREDTIRAYRGSCPYHAPVRLVDMPYVESFIEECQGMIDATYREFLKRKV